MEALPTRQSIGDGNEGAGENGGMTGRGGGGGDKEEDDTVGDNGSKIDWGVVRSEETLGWGECSGDGVTWVGERGGGRFGGGAKRGTGLETGGRGGGGRDREEGGGRGGREGRWEDFTIGGGGLGRHGRAGGWEGREGGERGEDEEMDGVSSAPVRGLVWPVSWETTLASIIYPQTECSTVICHSLSSIENPACSMPPFFSPC